VDTQQALRDLSTFADRLATSLENANTLTGQLTTRVEALAKASQSRHDELAEVKERLNHLEANQSDFDPIRNRLN